MPATTAIYIMHHLPKTGGVSIRNWLARYLGMHRGMVHYGVAGELLCMKHRLPFLEQMAPSQLESVRIVMGHYVAETTADFFQGREIRRIIVLREPVRRLISQYNHAMNFWCNMGRTPIDFYQWFETHAVDRYDYKDALRSQGLTPWIAFQSQASLGPNYMGRFIAQSFGKRDWPLLESQEFAAKVNELLESFWLVGLTERLADVAAALGHALGIPTGIAHENRGRERRTFLEPSEELNTFIREHNQADCRIYDHWQSKIESAACI
jgi:hypothetical protein